MKLKHVFYFQAIFALLPGLGFLFAPATLWNAMGTPSEGVAMDLAGRNTGVFLVTISLIAFFAARSENVPLRRNLTLAFAIFATIGFIVYVLPFLMGGPSYGPAWIMNLAFALAYGYFYFKSEGK